MELFLPVRVLRVLRVPTNNLPVRVLRVLRVLRMLRVGGNPEFIFVLKYNIKKRQFMMSDPNDDNPMPKANEDGFYEELIELTERQMEKEKARAEAKKVVSDSLMTTFKETAQNNCFVFHTTPHSPPTRPQSLPNPNPKPKPNLKLRRCPKDLLKVQKPLTR